MPDTHNLGLPLLAASQAQKHVTMNDALRRLDALTSPTVTSRSATVPPSAAFEGEAFLVPEEAGAAWAGQVGQLAFYVNGGWSFVEPKAGWQVWVNDEVRRVTYVGGRWVGDLIGPFAKGACSTTELVTHDIDLVHADINVAEAMIPSHSVVHCVTARVLETLDGPGLSTWRLGVSGSSNRYGSHIGPAKDSTCVGLSGSPLAYYQNTDLQVAPDSGTFSGGFIRLAVHFTQFRPADAI